MKEIKLTKKTNIIICSAMFLLMAALIYKNCIRHLSRSVAFSYGLVLSIVVIVGTIAAYWLYTNRRLALHWTYSLIAFSLGLFYMFMIPMYTVPDEAVHIRKAYEVSNVLMGIEDDPSDGLVMRREDAKYVATNQTLPIEATDYKFEDAFKMAQDTELIDTELVPYYDAGYQYFVPALGVTLGRLLGLGTMSMLLMGRFFNLLMFVGVVTLAIYLIPKHKMILVTIGLFPMTLQQGMSFSYDSFINAFAFLFFALIVRFSLKEDKLNIRELVILALVLFLILPTKHFAYFSLALLPLILVLKDKIAKREKTIIIVIVIIGLGLMAWDKIGPSLIAGPATEAAEDPNAGKHIIKWANEEGYTIGYLLAHPDRIPAIIIATLSTWYKFYLGTMVGDRLCWLEVRIPVIAALCLALAIFMNFFGLKEEPEKELTRRDKIIMLIAALISIACIFAGMLLSWTPISYLDIQGVQGRYFLPILPLIMVIFRTKRIKLGEWAPQVMLLLMIVGNYITAQNLIDRW